MELAGRGTIVRVISKCGVVLLDGHGVNGMGLRGKIGFVFSVRERIKGASS